MKRLLILLFASVAAVACQTPTAGNVPVTVVQGTVSVAEVAERACPPIESLIVVLQVSPMLSDGAKEEVANAATIIHALCGPDGMATAVGWDAFATKTLPALSNAILTSQLGDNEKQNAMLAITAAQIAVSMLR